MKQRDRIIQAVEVLFPKDAVVELRILECGRLGTVAGYFQLPEHQDELIEAVEAYNYSESYQANCYWTLNKVDPALLARAANRAKPYMKHTTNDDAILKRHWLFIDLDPVRYAGISASDSEKAFAKAKMEAIVAWLTQHEGWPEPVTADSGNGYHILYRISLPSNETSKILIEQVLKALAEIFDDEHVSVDTSTFNASRVLKVYGSVACKGDSVGDRKHRYSKLLTVPETLKSVTVTQLQAVAELGPEEKTPTVQSSTTGGRWTASMVQAGLEAAGIDFRKAQPYKAGTKWQHTCFDWPEHVAPGAFTFLDKNGWVSSKCSFTSCTGKSRNSREWGDTVERLAKKKIDRPVYVDRNDLKVRYLDEEDV